MAAEIVLPAVVADPLAGIHDEVEPDVLPIFLDEAAELFPQAGEQVRAWRRTPTDPAPGNGLRRTLHTFKGSARMAGAMRLGEIAHLMESRLMAGESPAPVTPELFDALDNDLDRIAYLLDRLRAGETNTPLPWVPGTAEAVAPVDEAAPPASHVAPLAPVVPIAPLPTESAGERAVAAIAPTVPVAPAATPTPAPIPLPAAAEAARSAAPEQEAGTRAMLRVRADMVDRLVNEAGEIAIARARIEGELRALKAQPARTDRRT